MGDREFPFLPPEIEEPNRGIYTEAEYERDFSWAIDAYVSGKEELEWLTGQRDMLRAKVGQPIPVRWENLRWLVWDRDGGICQVCLQPVKGEHYECGHIVDRCVGGPDYLSNLVVMHNLCNRLKPTHKTRAEYAAWVRSGAWMAELESLVLERYRRERNG